MIFTGRFQRANSTSGIDPGHDWHLDIHKDQIKRRLFLFITALNNIDRFLSAEGFGRGDIEFAQKGFQNNQVRQMIIHGQNMQALTIKLFMLFLIEDRLIAE